MKRRRIGVTFWLAIGLCTGSLALLAVSAWIRIKHFSYRSTEFHEFVFAGGQISYGVLIRPVSFINMMQTRPGFTPGWRVDRVPEAWAVFPFLKQLPSVEWTHQFRHVVMPLWMPFAIGASWLAIAWWRDRPPPPKYCAQCHYDLTGNVSGKCPECGSAVPIIPAIPAGEMFRRRRRVILRRRRFSLWMRRFAAVRRWSYTVGAACLALWWALSFIWAADHVSYEGDFANDQSLSMLAVSIEKGRLSAVVDTLTSVRPALLPNSIPATGWYMRRAGVSSTSSIYAFRGSLDKSITLTTSDLLGFALWIPLLVLVLLALLRWRRDRPSFNPGKIWERFAR